MKQFLFKLPLIIVSAFIYIQCAKHLPNGGKISGPPAASRGGYDKTVARPGSIAIKGISIKPTASNLQNLSLLNNIMVKTATHRVFYNPYLDFNSYGLIYKYAGEW